MGRYAIFNGLVYGGGTAVIPNPEGTPTDELHSIQIGDNIYEIVGGGGSGEGYSETLLYKYENGTTVDGIKTLNNDITNYDLLLFRLVFNVPTYTDHIISVSALEQVGYIPSPVATGPHVSIVSYASDYIRIVEGETKNKINIFEINGNEYIDEIYGIKIEGGSSSGGGNASLDATTLYDTPITSTGTYTLADDYNNYDFIGFKAGNGSTETDIRLYAVKDIQDSMNDNLVITNNVTNSWFNFTINENELTIPGKTVSTIYSVIGYKIKGGSSGASAIEKTLSEYNALTPAQKENGAIYMVQGEGASEDAFDMTQGSSYNEGSMSFTATETDIKSLWDGGGSIGGDWRTIAIDVTELTAIKFSIKTTTCYAHDNSNVEEQTNPRFVNTVYLFTSIPSGWAYDYESQATNFLKFAYTNTDYGEQEFDVSELTGQLYIIWASTGWNAVMSDLTLVGKSSLNNRIFFMNKEYANTGGGTGAGAIEKTQAEYNALTPEQKKNGAIYMVQGEVGEEKDLTERMSDYTSSSGTVSAYNSKSANFLAWHALASEDSFDARVNGEYWAGIGDGAYLQFDFTKPVMILKIGFASYLASNFKIMYSTDGNEYIYAQNVTREAQSGYVCTKTDTTLDSPIRDCVSIRLVCDGAEYNVGALHFYGYDSVESINKIYYMGTEYANTNGGSGGGDGYKLEKIFDGNVTTAGNITLTKSLDNYDELVFVMKQSSTYIRTDVIPIEFIKNIASYSTTHGVMIKDYSGYHRYFIVDYVDNTTLDITVIENTTLVEIYGVKHSAGCGGTSEGEGVEIYSENEYIVGRWIDGKKLYQRTVHLSNIAIPNGTSTIKYTDDSIEYAWVEKGIFREGRTDAVIPSIITNLTFDQSNTDRFGVGIDDVNRNYIKFFSSDTFSANVNRHLYITVRYTKTVETPAPAWGGSVTNNYAGFIDADNVIYSTISSSTTDTYTATEDCYIMQDIVTGSTVSTVNIDGETVAEYLVSGTQIISYNAFLKKGQVLTVTHGGTAQHTIKVFGITYASGGSDSGSSKIEYSTDEHVVGTWIDGRDVYEKTIYKNAINGRGNFLIADYPTKNDVDIFILKDISYIVNNNYINGVGICLETGSNTQGVFLDNNNAPSGFPTSFTDIYVTIRYVKKVGE